MNQTRRTYALIDRRAGAVVLTIEGTRAVAEYSRHSDRMSRPEAAELLLAYRRLTRRFPTVYEIRRGWGR